MNILSHFKTQIRSLHLVLKPSLALLTFYLCAYSAGAQELNSLQLGSNNQVSQFLTYHGNLGLGGNWQTKKNNPIGISLLDNEHRIKDSIHFPGELFTLNAFMSLSKNTYLAVGYDAGCYFLPKANRLHVLDSNLNISRSYPPVDYFFKLITEPFEEIALINENYVAMAHDTFLVSYNLKTGKTVDGRAFDEPIKSLLKSHEGGIALIEGSRFRKLDSTAEVTATISYPFKPLDLCKLTSGGYALIGAENFAALSNSGQLVYEEDWDVLSKEFDSLTHIKSSADSILLVGKQNDHWKMCVFNTNFKKLDCFNFGSADDPLIDWRFQNNTIISAHKKGLRNQRLDYLLKQPTTSNDSSVLLDLEITKLEIDSTILKEGLNNTYDPIFKLSSTIKYRGKDSLRDFFINWKSSIGQSCGGAVLSHKIRVDSLKNSHSFKIELSVQDSFLLPESEYEICLSVSSPNGKADTIESNNRQCINTKIPALSIEKRELAGQSTFPNIWSKSKGISINKTLTKMELYALNGQKVEQFESVWSGLSNGLYLLVGYKHELPFRQKVFIVD